MPSDELSDAARDYAQLLGFMRGFACAREAAAGVIEAGLAGATGQWSPKLAVEAIRALDPGAKQYGARNWRDA